MSLLSIIKNVSRQKPNRFLAPIPSESVDLFSLQNGIPYWFKTENAKPGWYWVKPETKSRASIQEKAQPHEYIGYLNQLPKMLAIVLFSLDKNRCLVAGYNHNPTFQQVYLTREHLICQLPLSVITVRKLGDILLYGGVGYSSQAIELSNKARECLDNPDLEVPKLFAPSFGIVSKRLKKEQIKQKQLTTEDKIKDELSFVGARLLSWDENEDGYTVEYEYEGEIFPIDLAQNRRVESAGICLDGTEADHNLSTIVLAMHEARRQHRFDLDENKWI